MFRFKKYKLVLILVASFLLIGSTSYAMGTIVSDNTPEGGYLLCASSKSGTVIYKAKKLCPSGYISLDLGAQIGGSAEYLVYAKSQDILASVGTKVDRTLISKSGFKKGYYSVNAELSLVHETTSFQLSLCQIKATGNSESFSSFPSHEVGNTWKSHNVQFIGLLYVDSPGDTITVGCSFTGNTKMSFGYLMLTPTKKPLISTTD